MLKKIKIIIYLLIFLVLIGKGVTWFFAKQIVDELKISFARYATVQHFPYVDFHWRGYISLKDARIYPLTYQDAFLVDEIRIHLPSFATLFDYQGWHEKPESISPIRIEAIGAHVDTQSPVIGGLHEILSSAQAHPLSRAFWPQCKNGTLLTPSWFVQQGQDKLTADFIIDYRVNKSQFDISMRSYWLGLFNITWDAQWTGDKMQDWVQNWPETAGLKQWAVNYEDTGLLSTFWHQCANNTGLPVKQYLAVRNKDQVELLEEMGLELDQASLQHLYDFYQEPQSIGFSLNPSSAILLSDWKAHIKSWQHWMNFQLNLNGREIPPAAWDIVEPRLKVALGLPINPPKPKPTGKEVYYYVWQELVEEQWHTARDHDVRITLKSGEIREGKLTEIFSQHLELSESVGSGYVSRRYAPWKVHKLEVKKRRSRIVSDDK